MKNSDRILLKTILRRDLVSFIHRCFQTVVPGEGGLYQAAVRRQDLRAERRSLFERIDGAFVSINAAESQLRDAAEQLGRELNERAQGDLVAAWRNLLVVSPLIALAFVLLRVPPAGKEDAEDSGDEILQRFRAKAGDTDTPVQNFVEVAVAWIVVIGRVTAEILSFEQMARKGIEYRARLPLARR